MIRITKCSLPIKVYLNRFQVIAPINRGNGNKKKSINNTGNNKVSVSQHLNGNSYYYVFLAAEKEYKVNKISSSIDFENNDIEKAKTMIEIENQL